MRNIKVIIAYAGTHYLGFQKTKEGPSIEESLEKGFAQILRTEVSIQGASRTDQGVHAQGQVINLFADVNDLPALKKSVQAVLPKDIALLALEFVPFDFHPTLDAKSKEYHYYMCNSSFQLPFYREHSWHYPYPLDAEKMQAGANLLIGAHDFSAFANQNEEKLDDCIREIYSLKVEPLIEDRLKISITGNKFLYKMVRNIVGTLVYIGQGKIPLEHLLHILESHDRTKAGITAPAKGLFLYQVNY